MAIHKPKNFLKAIKDNTRLMALDLGDKTIGIAISNAKRNIATPITIIRRKKFAADAAALFEIMQEYEIGGLVLGWPLNMNGSQGARCDKTLSFADSLLKYNGFKEEPEIVLIDERLSTMGADRVLIGEADLSRKRRKEVIDKTAATLIMQTALDKLALAEKAD